MKKLLTLLLLAFFASCGDRESESTDSGNILENLSLSIDTVVIDVGEEIFMPGAYSTFAISEDEDRVFTFYEPNTEVHEIDLNNNKLVARHKFEKDGPDMVPLYANHLQSLNENELFIANFYTSGIYKHSGKKVKGFPFATEEYSGFDPDFSATLGFSPYISPDKKAVLFFPREGIDNTDILAVINGEKMSAKLVELPALELSKNYRVRVSDGSVGSGQSQRVSWAEGKFLIYSDATSDIYLFDHIRDSLRLITFPHQLVPNARSGDFPNEVESYEKFREVTNEISKLVTFSQLFFDKSRQIYLRFAQMNWGFDQETETVSGEIYLFSYDKEFNLTGEVEIEELESIPFQSFMKDGKLYSRWVVGENPAFIVHSFDF